MKTKKFFAISSLLQKYHSVDTVLCRNLIFSFFIFHFNTLAQFDTSIKVKKIFTINEFSLTTGEQNFNNPEGIFYDSNKKQILIADTNNNKIYIFNSKDGAPFYEIKDEIKFPKNLVVNSAGKIFVLGKDGTIKKFNNRYKYSEDLKFPEGKYKPINLTIDDDDNLYVLDKENCSILIFDRKDKFQFKFGSCGKNIGEFLSPEDIAVDFQDNIYILDSKRISNVVQVFNKEGKYKLGFGKIGNLETDFSKPEALFIDRFKKIWVVDSYQHKVKVFNHGGGFLFQIGGMQNEDISFFLPIDIALDDSDRVYVLEKGTNQLQVFFVGAGLAPVIMDSGQ